MKTTIPISAPVFQRGDVAGTVRKLCDSMRTLEENLNFLLGQIEKESQGKSEAVEELKEELGACREENEALKETVEKLTARLSALEMRA